MGNEDNHTGVLLEDIQDKLQRLAESLNKVPGDVAQLKADIVELKQDVKVIRVAVTDQSKHVNDHEVRITALEPLH